MLAVADALDIIVAASSGSAVVQEEYYHSCNTDPVDLPCIDCSSSPNPNK